MSVQDPAAAGPPESPGVGNQELPGAVRSTDVLINVRPFETRIAVVDDGRLSEAHHQRDSASSMAGNIHLGRVDRVLPGIQAAFVDIGADRPGFLHVRDVRRAADSADGDRPPIERVLREGQWVQVQVTKDPIGSKGPRLSMHLSLPSRLLVLVPHASHLGISQRIENEDERDRLRGLVERMKEKCAAPAGFGFIVRTVAEGASEHELAADLVFLLRLWKEVEAQIPERADAPGLIYEDLPGAVRVIRDLSIGQLRGVHIDCPETFAAVRRFVGRFLPDLLDAVHLHESRIPLFEEHGVETALGDALDARVALPCGGSLIIEQTEAMVTIDVNTGGFVGGRTAAETVLTANLEAAREIPHQLRLRNLGGIVVIDFIDMESDEDREQVLAALADASAAEGGRMRISGFSQLGLVELSRKRVRESLHRDLCAPCDACGGRGFVRSPESVCNEVLRMVERTTRSGAARVLVRAAPELVDLLSERHADTLARMWEDDNVHVELRAEACFAGDGFDVLALDPANGAGRGPEAAGR